MDTPAPTAQELAAQAAAAAAAQQFNVEAFTLLAIGLLITVLRTYARVTVNGGFKSLQLDDYLAWFAAFCYAAETGLAYSVGNAAHGLANNGMTPDQRSVLSVDDPEYGLRVLGSKIQLAGWSVYGTLLWSLKGSLLVLYSRLTAGLDRHYEIRIRIGYVAIVVSYLTVIMNLLLGCRPFNHYWQISPDPGNVCQPAVANEIVWIYYAFNVTTDIYLLTIPLPMLFISTMKLWRKVGLMFLFSGGTLVIVCATVRCVIIFTNPVEGAQNAGSWAVRETFVAVITTNLPIVYPLFHKLLTKVYDSLPGTKRSTDPYHDKPRDFVTIGGSGGPKRTPTISYPISKGTFSESEERIMGVVHLQDMKKGSSESSAARREDDRGIQKQIEVTVARRDHDGSDDAKIIGDRRYLD